MKRYVCHISLIAALLAAPAAWAGSAIVKCTDRDGHVTLTDQPCADGAAALRLSAGPDAPGSAAPASAPAVGHYPAPRALPRSGARTRPEPKRMNLSRDAATLKEARAQLLWMDGAGKGLPQPKLARLN